MPRPTPLTPADFPIQVRCPVLWGDMDAARHVNNIVYLRWTETARVVYMDAMGMDTSFRGPGVGPIIGWQDCKYIFPLEYGDTALVGARTTEILQDRFVMQCAVFSERHDRLAALSLQHIIPYSYGELRKVALPEEWVRGIRAVSSGPSRPPSAPGRD